MLTKPVTTSIARTIELEQRGLATLLCAVEDGLAGAFERAAGIIRHGKVAEMLRFDMGASKNIGEANRGSVRHPAWVTARLVSVKVRS